MWEAFIEQVLKQVPLVGFSLIALYITVKHFKDEVNYEREERQKIINMNAAEKAVLTTEIRNLHERQEQTLLLIPLNYERLQNLKTSNHKEILNTLNNMETELKIFVDKRIYTIKAKNNEQA